MQYQFFHNYYQQKTYIYSFHLNNTNTSCSSPGPHDSRIITQPQAPGIVHHPPAPMYSGERHISATHEHEHDDEHLLAYIF